MPEPYQPFIVPVLVAICVALLAITLALLLILRRRGKAMAARAAASTEELKKVESTSVRWQSRLRAVASSLADGVMLADAAGNIIEWNAAALHIHGFTRAEDACQPLAELARHFTLTDMEGNKIASDDHPMARILRGETLNNCELKLRRVDNQREVLINCSGMALRDAAGKVDLAVLTLRDVTERRRAEAEEKRSASLLQAIVECATDAVYVKDREGRYLLFNPAAARLVGKPAAEVLGKKDADIFEPESARRLLMRDRRVLETGLPDSTEEALTAVGVTRTYFCSKAAHRDAAGKIVGIVGIAHDMSAWKLAQAELQLRDRAIQAVSQGIVITEANKPDHPIIYVSPGFERLTGYTAAEALGKNCRFLQGPATDPAMSGMLRHAIEAGRECSVEILNYRKNGRTFWNSLHISPVRDQEGRLTHFVGVQADVTQRRHADSLLESLLNSVLDAVIGIDDEGRIQSYNRAAERIFGYSALDAIGEEINQLMPESEVDNPQPGIATLIGKSREVTARRKDGTPFPADLAVGEFFLDEQRYFTCVVRDISERRRLEIQFHQAQKMEAIGQLAGGVAHDFNNLLTIINGYSEHLLDTLPAEDANRAAIAAIRDAGERATGLTTHLLTFSRKSMLEPKVIDVNEVVAETGKMLRRLIGEDIQLQSLLGQGVGRVKVDPGQLGQVLMNLVVNARDAMPKGGKLTVETRHADLDDDYAKSHTDVRPGKYVLLSVADTGTGMGNDVKARIFEPFYTTKAVGKGTGLGLATVYGIVRQSGGHIDVESEINIGTTFNVYFPAVEEDLYAQAGANAAEVRGGSEVILLVEDQEGVRRMTTLVLKKQGYTVLEAADAREAMRLIEGTYPHLDLLATDVVMPGMSGRELAEAMLPLYPGLKVLYLSGYTDDAVIRHGVLQSEVAFLLKPYTPSILARKVREVLDQA